MPEQTSRQGYGSYKKQYESDVLQETIANVELDKDLRKRREKIRTGGIDAAKVIAKYNSNSIRVMDSMKIHGKRDQIDESDQEMHYQIEK